MTGCLCGHDLGPVLQLLNSLQQLANLAAVQLSVLTTLGGGENIVRETGGRGGGGAAGFRVYSCGSDCSAAECVDNPRGVGEGGGGGGPFAGKGGGQTIYSCCSDCSAAECVYIPRMMIFHRWQHYFSKLSMVDVCVLTQCRCCRYA